MNLRPALENAHTLVQRTDIFSCKFSAKVSLMLGNPFLVPSLCKLNHISLCFIQISTKSAYSLQGKQCFFWSHPQCFGPLGKFQHKLKISINTTHVSRLAVSCDYGLSQQKKWLLSLYRWTARFCNSFCSKMFLVDHLVCNFHIIELRIIAPLSLYSKFLADLVTLNEEIPNGKLHFLCRVNYLCHKSRIPCLPVNYIYILSYSWKSYYASKMERFAIIVNSF